MEDKNNAELLAEMDCEVYCKGCKKLINIKAGQPIPDCCGKPMEIFD